MERMKELINILNNASRSYYQKNESLVSDFEYDKLYDELMKLEEDTGVILANSPTQNVGYTVLSNLTKVKHDEKILSLDKTKEPEKLKSWLENQEGVLSWKLDGLTIVLKYNNGELVQAITRGNGEVGEDITHNAKVFKNIPLKISYKDELIIRGEGIISYSDFERINEELDENESYKNPRNLCSGTVRQLNSEITSKRNVMFYAFTVFKAFGVDFDDKKSNQLLWLKTLGYDVVYTAPKNEAFYRNAAKSCFTREYGDCVDDWNSHNSYSRVAREWGEEPQIRQAQHYARKDYGGCLMDDQVYKAPRGHIGGALWHSFDHQRGYHPDPFWGGLMDMFRQPKYSYYMMMSQRDPHLHLEQADSGPMVYIANAMTPFSPEDIVVYTNCDSVRVIVNEKDTLVQVPLLEEKGIRHPPVVFKGAYSFVDVRALHRAGKPEQCSIVAEGFLDGKIVARTKNMPSKRNEQLVLTVDSGLPLRANGSDMVTVIASITDKDGYVKRLSQETVIFEVEGEGELVGGREVEANPRVSRWGTAPALIRTTTKAGTIKIKARLLHPGIQFHPQAVIEIATLPAERVALYRELPVPQKTEIFGKTEVGEIDFNEIERLAREEQERINEMKQVEQQQRHFESTEKK